MKKTVGRILAAATPFFAFAGAAFAEAGAEGGGSGGIITIVGYLLFFGVIMYLMVFLPQRRKDKKAKELMNSLQVGHRVTTHSGIVGKVVNIKDDVVTVESGVERTQIEVKKWAIRDIEKPIEA